MTLNQTDSALLKTALDAENSLFYWLEHDTTAINNIQHDAIVDKFEAWQEAYELEDLYVTTGSGTQQVEGIDSVPIPPRR